MDEEQIVALYFERSERAIEETEKKYGRYCKSISMNILGNEADAGECVNDAYLQAWNTMPPRRPASLTAYIGMLIRNISINRLAYNRAKKRNAAFDVVLSEVEECLSSGAPDPCDELTLTEALDRFLEELPQETRIIFMRRYWYADSVRAIAQALEIGEPKVKAVLARTRKKLRAFLEKEQIEV